MFRRLALTFVFISFAGFTESTHPKSTCPSAWFDIQLPVGSKTCRIFGVKKPATLSFFVVDSPEAVAKSLAQQLENAQTAVEGRYLTVRSEDQQYRAYIFKDGAGTQVNLMLN
ncbi:hypothetical protein [Planctobacterium marinum]|uniref:Uncharacterized protein n=1 Tax=Planctobacterium marinum TaxID=1631968 RepID=A0AA48I3S2_9ALTE|nr:hypothetical protein MACH26_08910 [Planctobacterium marinum]